MVSLGIEGHEKHCIVCLCFGRSECGVSVRSQSMRGGFIFRSHGHGQGHGKFISATSCSRRSMRSLRVDREGA
jgi:hypothetical protein